LLTDDPESSNGGEAVDDCRLTLALVEAQVGSLVDVLPVGLLVTSASGEILRANQVATELLGHALPLVGLQVTRVLPFISDLEPDGNERVWPKSVRGAILTATGQIHPLDVRLRWLRHAGDVLRLYVLHET
jgi:PAS domain-containing protein